MDEGSDTDNATPLTSYGRANPHGPAPAVVLLIGLVPTLVVLVGMVAVSSVWAAIFGVEASWLIAPACVCAVWPASRRRVLEAWRAATQRLPLQALVGATLWAGSAGTAVLLFWLVGRHTGVVPGVRSRAAEYGLSETHPAAVWFFVVWFSIVNPVLEELFWRIFLFEHMQPWTKAAGAREHAGDEGAGSISCEAAAVNATRGGGGGGRAVAAVGAVETTPIAGGAHAGVWPSGWGWSSAAVATSALYAAYHFSVLLIFLPWPWAIFAELFVFGYGVALQLLTGRLGVVAAMLMHAGGDAVVAFVLADCIWDFMPLLRLRRL